ncbi:MAG: hypothetical protein TUN42_09615 [Dehalogenimonas sp.]
MARELTHCFVKIPVKPLDDITLEKVRSLEKKLGVQLIAFASKNDEHAKLSDAELAEVERLGTEIEARIVAYKTLQPARRQCIAC